MKDLETKDLEVIYEGIFDRTGARLSAVKAGITGIAKDVVGAGKGGQRSVFRNETQKAKTYSIVDSFKNDLSKLFGKDWDLQPQFKGLKQELDKIYQNPFGTVSQKSQPPKLPATP